MYIRHRTIKNFRSIPPEGIQIRFGRERTILVGKNNSGKTNILDALSIVLGPANPFYKRLEPTDYHDPSKPVEILVTLAGVTYALLGYPQGIFRVRELQTGDRERAARFS